jgi:hypothetical protein
MSIPPEVKVWLRSLPLLLSAAILLMTGAWFYLRDEQGGAATAAMAAGLVVLGAWLVTAVLDWAWGRKPQAPQGDEWIRDEPMEGDDGGPA